MYGVRSTEYSVPLPLLICHPRTGTSYYAIPITPYYEKDPITGRAASLSYHRAVVYRKLSQFNKHFEPHSHRRVRSSTAYGSHKAPSCQVVIWRTKYTTQKVFRTQPLSVTAIINFTPRNVPTSNVVNASLCVLSDPCRYVQMRYPATPGPRHGQ